MRTRPFTPRGATATVGASTHARAHTHTHARTHARTRTHAHARTRAHTRTHARTRTQARTRAHTQACTHARTRTYAPAVWTFWIASVALNIRASARRSHSCAFRRTRCAQACPIRPSRYNRGNFQSMYVLISLNVNAQVESSKRTSHLCTTAQMRVCVCACACLRTCVCACVRAGERGCGRVCVCGCERARE